MTIDGSSRRLLPRRSSTPKRVSFRRNLHANHTGWEQSSRSGMVRCATTRMKRHSNGGTMHAISISERVDAVCVSTVPGSCTRMAHPHNPAESSRFMAYIPGVAGFVAGLRTYWEDSLTAIVGFSAKNYGTCSRLSHEEVELLTNRYSRFHERNMRGTARCLSSDSRADEPNSGRSRIRTSTLKDKDHARCQIGV